MNVRRMREELSKSGVGASVSTVVGLTSRTSKPVGAVPWLLM